VLLREMILQSTTKRGGHTTQHPEHSTKVLPVVMLAFHQSKRPIAGIYNSYNTEVL